jgi:hypothetical protein
MSNKKPPIKRSIFSGWPLAVAVVLTAVVLVIALFTHPTLKRLHSQAKLAAETIDLGTLDKESVKRVEIFADSGSTPVNAVQIRGTYPADQLEYVGIDGVGSGFAVSAESQGSEGTFAIARGSIKPVSGNVKVATIIFRYRTKAADSAKVDLGNPVLVSSESNQNILGAGAARVYIKE